MSLAWNEMLKMRLRNAPKPVKALALSYTAALSLAYLYAIINIGLVIGLTPAAIATHYYGSAHSVDIQKVETSGEQELNLENDVVDTKQEIGPRPSFKNLVAEGHFHLFGMTSFFFGLTLLSLFTGLTLNQKTWMMIIPYVAVVLDNVSFMITRFGGPKFAYLTVMAGALMGMSFIILWLSVVSEVLKKADS